jgi:hypothetical protein
LHRLAAIQMIAHRPRPLDNLALGLTLTEAPIVTPGSLSVWVFPLDGASGAAD